jgi:N-acetylglucosaminyl-diphospho-decaprenol L-rhamnosyltransferase
VSATGEPRAVVAVVVNWNAGALLEACVRSLVDDGVAEVVVADNASTDGSADAVAALGLPGVRVVPTGANLGYGAGANRGAAAAGPGDLLICNPDLVVDPGATAALAARLAAEPDLGIIAPGLRNPDGSPYVTGRPFPSLKDALGHAFLGLVWHGNPWSARYLRLDWDRSPGADVDWASGACLLVRRALWERLGGFDERFFMFMEDTDQCWRAREEGFRVAVEPAAQVVHVVGASRKRRRFRMIAAHHRSMFRWSSLRWQGWRRVGLPLVAVALVARACLVTLAEAVGRAPGRAAQRSADAGDQRPRRRPRAA